MPSPIATVATALENGWVVGLICVTHGYPGEGFQAGHGATYGRSRLRGLPPALSLAALAKGSRCPVCGGPVVDMAMQETPGGNGSLPRDG